MRKIMVSSILALAVAGAGLAGAWADVQVGGVPMPPAAPDQNAPKPQQVPVKEIVLYSTGVGFFSHEGTVTGNATTELRFKTTQINDILKSLVLQDAGGGKVTAVTYPSQDPLNKALKSFQIDISGNPSMADLLDQLRGAKVSLKAGDHAITGTILGVEKKQHEAGPADDKKIIEVSCLNLVTDNGIQSVDLEQAQDITLDDPELRDELKQALAAVSQARDKDKKPVIIKFEGQGDRLVRIGYVVETPIWKTSYRLMLTEGKGKSSIQGWAIIENQTDNDWNNIRLNLVGGRPISFIEDLYQPLYVPRPVVQPEVFASLTPQTYGGGVDKQADQLATLQEDEAKVMSGERGGAMAAAPMAANSSAQMFAARESKRGAVASIEELRKADLNYAQGVASIAAATKVGEMFEFAVDNVSLARQRSAMIPIITDDIDGEAVSIYNAGVMPRHPLLGVRLKNDTGKYLLGGPIAVFTSNVYAGDAQIEDIPPGQQRLLSFAIDQAVEVNPSQQSQNSSILTGTIVKGVLQLTYKDTFDQKYVIENKGDMDKTIVIEHPINVGYKLITPDNALETTESLYRFQTAVPAKKAGEFPVHEERVRDQGVAILGQDVNTIGWYIQQGQIPQKVKDALGDVIKRKNVLTDVQRKYDQKQQDKNQIVQDQARIREDMKVVDKNSAYYGRLQTKLNDQETKLEKIDGDMDDLRQAINSAQADLEKYLEQLSI